MCMNLRILGPGPLLNISKADAQLLTNFMSTIYAKLRVARDLNLLNCGESVSFRDTNIRSEFIQEEMDSVLNELELTMEGSAESTGLL